MAGVQMHFSLSRLAKGTASWNVTSPAHASYPAKSQATAAGWEATGSQKMLEGVVHFCSSLLRDMTHLRTHSYSILSFCHSLDPSPSPP